MHKSLVALAILSVMSVPAAAQNAPQTPPTQSKPLMVKKLVCHRIVEEEDSGSRLGAAPKECKTVEVPAPVRGATANQQQPPSQGSGSGR